MSRILLAFGKRKSGAHSIKESFLATSYEIYPKQVAPSPFCFISCLSGFYDWGNWEDTAAGPRTQGSWANYWSSTRNGGNSYNLNFSSSNLNPQNSNNRGNGFTLRCVAQ